MWMNRNGPARGKRSQASACLPLFRRATAGWSWDKVIWRLSVAAWPSFGLL